MRTTFTVLVTLEHDATQGHSPSRIAEIVQCALEEGTSCSGGFNAAQVDAFKGNGIDAGVLGSADQVRYALVLPMHGTAA